MYIVRWLLGNPIVATWVALALGIVATLLIFGTGNGDKGEVLSSDSSIASSAQKGEAVPDINNYKSVSTDNEGKEEILSSDSSITSSTQEVGVSIDSTKDKAVTSDVAIEENTITTVASDAEKDKSGKDESVPAELAAPPLKSELDKVSTAVEPDSAKSTAIADLGQATNEEMLLMAREAYWNNGLDEAAQIYKKLIENEPEVLEHRGELGNVYWRQGYPEKAAELYSEIAIPMIENGGSERVANMIGFIGLFYPDRAAKIHQKMQENK